MAKKYISIIIPTLNEGVGVSAFLSQLQPLRNDCELILADGGSSDNTRAKANGLVDHIVDCNKGRAVQMNAGAAIASAPILLFLHADTFLPVNAIEAIRRGFEEDHRWGRFDIQLDDASKILSIVAWMMNKRSRWSGIATGDQAIFIEKTLFEQLSGFAEISLMEDIDLSSRLKKYEKPYCIDSKISTSARRWNSFGIVKTIGLMWWIRLQYFLGVKPNYLAELYNKGQFWKA